MTLVLPMAADQERIRELGAYFDWASQSEERAQLAALATEDAQIAQAVTSTDKIVATKGDHACNRCQRLIPSGSRVWSVSVQRGRGRGGCWWTCEECRPTGEEKRAMTVHALLRVSREDQSIENQRAQALAYTRANGLPEPVWHEEPETRGRAKDRPVRDAMLASAVEGDLILVAALDRVGRSAIETIRIVVELHKRKIRFVSIREQLDFGSTIGQMVASNLAFFAQLEVEIISARTKASMRHSLTHDGKCKTRNGFRVGRPGAFYAPETYAEVQAARAAGVTWKQVAATYTACRRRWVPDAPEADGSPSKSGRWEIVNGARLDAKQAKAAFRRTGA